MPPRREPSRVNIFIDYGALHVHVIKVYYYDIVGTDQQTTMQTRQMTRMSSQQTIQHTMSQTTQQADEQANGTGRPASDMLIVPYTATGGFLTVRNETFITAAEHSQIAELLVRCLVAPPPSVELNPGSD